MSKLQDIFTSVENQLQWGPALKPFFLELITEIDALNAQIAGLAPLKAKYDESLEFQRAYDANQAQQIASIQPLTLQQVEADPEIKAVEQSETDDESKVSALSAVVSALETKLDGALHGLASLVSSEQAQEAQPVAAGPVQTPSPSVSTAQPEPAPAAPTSEPTPGVVS